MASATPLGNDKYKIFVELGYNDKGKRIRKTKTVTAKSERALKKAITEFEIEVANSNTAMDIENITFNDFVERWFKVYVEPELSVKTMENYRYWTNHFMMNQLGDLKMNKIKTFHIVQYFNTERKSGRKSLKQKFIALKSIFSKAVKWEVIKENPMNGVDRPQTTERKRDGKLFCYDEQQLKMLLEALKKEKVRFRMQVKLACLVGLRRSEINGLRMTSFNFKNNTIVIDKTLVWHKFDKKYTLGPTKNKKARTVYVPETFMKELREYAKEQKKFKLECGPTWKGFVHEEEEVDLFFTSLKGGPLRSEFFNSEWYKFLERNKDLPPLNIHGLRHTYASILINKGVNFKVIQEQLGHESINETINTYSHLTTETKKASSIIFEEIL